MYQTFLSPGENRKFLYIILYVADGTKIAVVTHTYTRRGTTGGRGGDDLWLASHLSTKYAFLAFSGAREGEVFRGRFPVVRKKMKPLRDGNRRMIKRVLSNAISPLQNFSKRQIHKLNLPQRHQAIRLTQNIAQQMHLSIPVVGRRKRWQEQPPPQSHCLYSEILFQPPPMTERSLQLFHSKQVVYWKDHFDICIGISIDPQFHFIEDVIDKL